MNALDDYRFEMAVAIRAEHHVLVQLDLALKHRATEDQAYALAEVARVDNELGVHIEHLLRRLKLLLVLLVDAVDHLRDLLLLS